MRIFKEKINGISTIESYYYRLGEEKVIVAGSRWKVKGVEKGSFGSVEPRRAKGWGAKRAVLGEWLPAKPPRKGLEISMYLPDYQFSIHPR